MLLVSSPLVKWATPFLTRAALDYALPDRNLPLLIGLVSAMTGVTLVTGVALT